MRKNRRDGKIEIVCLAIFAVFIFLLMISNAVAMYIHCASNKMTISPKESLWEEGDEDSDAFDISKILKKHSIRGI